MDPRKLLYMKSVVEHRSLSKAAKELHVSQPALSISMARLEASLGVKLLVRGPQGVVPTPAGELLYSRALFIQDEIDIARHQIQHREEVGKAQSITVGAIVSIVANVVPRALCRWREQYPDVQLRIVENSYPELFAGLMRADLDFIIAQTGCSELCEGIKQRVLFRDCLVIYARPSHPILKGPITWPELARYPWVTHLIWRQMSPAEQIMKAEGVRATQQLTECSSVSFMKTVMENSDHLGMLPEHALSDELAQGRLVPLPITSPLMNRNIAVFFRERTLLDEASRSFLDKVAETGSRLCKRAIAPKA